MEIERVKRTERLGVMAQILTETPNRIHSFSEFCEMFSAAKSTVSEDIGILAKSFEKYDRGVIETIAGAAGGVRYRTSYSSEKAAATLGEIAGKLMKEERLLPGGFLYTSDIASDPSLTAEFAGIIAARYYNNQPDVVLTMETKGIPIALMTARALGASLVVARRDSKAYEGSAVKINYVSGGAGERIETMALSRRAVKPGQKVLIVDDFAKGGGTLQGMVDMMREFQCEVIGVEVMIAARACREKTNPQMHALLYIEDIDRATNSCRVSVGDIPS